MALFDQKKFLLSHIRHSFITGDDTGVCEAVMLHEILPHRTKKDTNYEFLEELMIKTKSDLENAQSFDIVSNMDIFGSHRRRSNTAQRLERLKLEKKKKTKVKVIQWKNSSDNQITEQEINDYFPIKNPSQIKIETEVYKKKKSLLAKQIFKYPTAPVNPFNDYSKFDARLSETNGNSKRLTIYITMLNEEERKKPVVVEVVNTAKIQDLIGLICWQFTNNQEGKEPFLKPNVNNYCLRIAEENGEVDPDFPCLNANELVAKFGFPTLALEDRKLDEENCLLITVHIDQVFTKIEVPSLDVTMNYILDAVTKKRKDILESKKNYEFKKMNNESITLNKKLSDVRDKEFKLVLTKEKTIPEDSSSKITNEIPDLEAIEATLYKCFNVVALPKYFNPVEVQLGISGKKVDVTPSNSNVKNTTNKFWKVFQTKPTSFNVENIVECNITNKNLNLPEDRAIFKIVYYNGNNFSSQKFESNVDTANKIVKKLQYLMEMRSSILRDEWLKTKK